MGIDLLNKFWKEYIESDLLKREELLKVPIKRFEEIAKLYSELKNDKSDRISEESKELVVLNFLRGFFDDLIETMFILNDEENTKNNLKLKEEIEDLIDHYTPYRPLTDTKEMKEVRKVLIEVVNKVGL